MEQELLKRIIQMKNEMDPSFLEKFLELSREEEERRRKEEEEKKKRSEDAAGVVDTKKDCMEKEEKRKGMDLIPDSLTDSEYYFKDANQKKWVGHVHSLSLPTKKELELHFQRNPWLKNFRFWIQNGDTFELSSANSNPKNFIGAYLLPVLHLAHPLHDLEGKEYIEQVDLLMSMTFPLTQGADSLTFIAREPERMLVCMEDGYDCNAIQYYLDGLLFNQFLMGKGIKK